MNGMQIIVLAALASLPLVTLLMSGRLGLAVWRTLRRQERGLALLFTGALLAQWALLGVLAGAWFVLAVGHGPKPLHETLLLLAVSLMLVHGVALGFWRLARRLDPR